MARGIRRNGRSKGGPAFVQLYNYVLDSPAFRSLSSTERSVLLAVARRFNGKNNGSISFAAREGEAWGHSKSTTAEALKGLVKAGFLRITQPGAFTTKRLAATYALTWHPTDKGLPATQDFKKGETKTSPTQRTDSLVGRTVGKNPKGSNAA